MLRFADTLIIDIATNRVIEYRPFYTRDTNVFRAKKGRERQDKIAEDRYQQQLKDQKTRDALKAETDPFRKSLIPGTPGELSPYVKANYGSAMDRIAATYDNLRRQGLRSLAAQGFRRGPSGALASVVNTINDLKGQAETDAYTQAQDKTTQLGLEGLGSSERQMNIINPNQTADVASKANQVIPQMGSTLGDIGAGIKAAADIATTVVGMPSALKKAWKGN
jgi:hypothetical protein